MNSSNRAKKKRKRWFIFDNSAAFAGFIIILIFTFIAAFAPFLSPYDPLKVNMGERLKSPGRLHLLGTDHLGRDILSRVIWGARISIMVGLISVGLAMVIGIILGVISGYAGGTTDMLVMRFIDILLSFPLILLAIMLIAFFGSNLTNLMLAVGLSMAPRFTRIVRAATLAVKENEFIQAVSALGAKNLRIYFRHILPNITSSIIVTASLYIATAILIESNLSYLGLGIKPPEPTWGSIINDGRKVLREAPWISLFSGFAIMINVMGFNLFGDGLRDALDPRLKGE